MLCNNNIERNVFSTSYIICYIYSDKISFSDILKCFKFKLAMLFILRNKRYRVFICKRFLEPE